MTTTKNGTAGPEVREALQVELPVSVLNLLAQAASQNGEIAQRLVGFLEGGGYSIDHPWVLVIRGAVMVEKLEVKQ